MRQNSDTSVNDRAKFRMNSKLKLKMLSQGLFK